MNKLLIFLFCASCFFSCTSSSYEKAIADWVQTDKDGTWTDLKFKLVEVQSIEDITVSDSLSILKKRFESIKKRDLDILKHSLEGAKSRMSFAKYAGVNQESYQKDIDVTQSKIDSLENKTFHSVYDGKDDNEVIAKILKCRYAITPPVLNARQEMNGSFILSPDMKRCFGQLSEK